MKHDETLYVTDDERTAFFAKVDIRGPDDCWEWQGTRQKPGPARQLPYGIVHFRAHQLNSHRLSWMIEHGQVPAKGLVVRHKCHNAPCCNPAHLLIGTQKDNNRDMVEAGRNRVPSRGSGPQVTRAEIKAMSEYRCRTLAELSRKFKRDPGTIRRAFKRFGVPQPTRRRTDADWQAIAAENHASVNSIVLSHSVSHRIVRLNFIRLGIPLPPPSPSLPRSNDYWREVAQQDWPSMLRMAITLGHSTKTIKAHFKRLGLPLPDGRRRPQ